jgi:hypothetical protein
MIRISGIKSEGMDTIARRVRLLKDPFRAAPFQVSLHDSLLREEEDRFGQARMDNQVAEEARLSWERKEPFPRLFFAAEENFRGRGDQDLGRIGRMQHKIRQRILRKRKIRAGHKTKARSGHNCQDDDKGQPK